MDSGEYVREDATGLAALVAAGEVTAAELLDAALEQCDRLNPTLNAVVHARPDTARAKIAEGLPRGPFMGVPFLIKDLGCEAIDFATSMGSKLCAGTRWRHDSTMFERLRATGLNTFARTTSPEFGIGPVTEAQVYGGPTRNPWNTGRTSGGSSGGSGAAVAAGIVPAAHGSDGGGSVRIPAASCGLVGFKPTRARLPAGPARGEGWGGMAIDGVLTRSLRDTAALLDACAGPEPGAPYVAPEMQEAFMQAMVQDPPPLRVGLVTTSFVGAPLHPECVIAAERAGALLEDLGHHVEPWVPEPEIDVPDMMQAWTQIVACGTANTVAAILGGRPLDPALLEGVTRGAIAYAAGISGADYVGALSRIHAFGRRMARALGPAAERAAHDIILSPTLAEPPCELGRLKPDSEDFLAYRTGPGMVFDYSPFTAIFNASGQPAVSLPLHWTEDDLPVGVHLAAPFGADAMLMRLAGQIERAAPWAGMQQRLLDRGGLWRDPARDATAR